MVKIPSIYDVLSFLLIVSIWAFNEEKYISYPVKVLYIIVFGFYCVKNRKMLNKYQIWCLIMMVLSSVSVFVASSIEVALYTYINFIQVLLIAYVSSGYLDSIDKVRRLIFYVMLAGSILALRFLIIEPDLFLRTGYRLGEAIGYNANDVGNKAALSAIFGLTLVNNNMRKLSLISFVINMILVLLSGSRKALGAVALFVLIFYTTGIKKKRYVLLSILLFALLCIASYNYMLENEFLYAVIGRRIESLIYVLQGGNEASSIDLRAYYMSMAFQYVIDNPILGIGLGNFAVVSGIGVYSHCDYLEVLCSFGIVLGIVYYLPCFYLLYQMLKTRLKTKMDFCLISILMVLLVNYLSMVMYISAYNQLLICLIYSYRIFHKKGDDLVASL